MTSGTPGRRKMIGAILVVAGLAIVAFFVYQRVAPTVGPRSFVPDFGIMAGALVIVFGINGVMGPRRT